MYIIYKCYNITSEHTKKNLCYHVVISFVQVENDVNEKVTFSLIKTLSDFRSLSASPPPCESLCLTIQLGENV